jgi:hypothetical protein
MLASVGPRHEREGPIKRSTFSEEQIAFTLRHAESGTPVADVSPQLGVSEATFCLGKKKYAHLGVCEVIPEIGVLRTDPARFLFVGTPSS